MPTKTTTKRSGAMKKGVAYWKTDWMTKVMSNGYNPQAKLVFMRIASFGENGCWMNNETFGEEFNRSDRTIRRAISRLWEKGDVIVLGWNGHGRKMYAAGHPHVPAKMREMYNKAKSAGKANTPEEFFDKVRKRMKEAPPEKPATAVKAIEKPYVPKGLAHYQTKKTPKK